jgi:hypothetical protein
LQGEWKGGRGKHIAIGTVMSRPVGLVIIGITTLVDVPETPCVWVIDYRPASSSILPSGATAVPKLLPDIRAASPHLFVGPSHDDYPKIHRATTELMDSCAAAPDRFRAAILQLVRPTPAKVGIKASPHHCCCVPTSPEPSFIADQAHFCSSEGQTRRHRVRGTVHLLSPCRSSLLLS